MTPNHDHATLFLAPSLPPGTEKAGRTQPTVDHTAKAMRALCQPFAVCAEPATVPAR
jgi:hypothetical protein